MKDEIDERISPILEAIETRLPMSEFAVTLVVMDQRDGKDNKINVYGNRRGDSKYYLLAHALRDGSKRLTAPESDLPEALQALNAKMRGDVN